MRIKTTAAATVHTNTGEKQREIYVESKDCYISLKDKTVVFYVEKGYVEDFEDPILQSTIKRDYLLSRNVLKIEGMTTESGPLIEAIEAKIKEIIIEKISLNEDYLSGLSAYTFE